MHDITLIVRFLEFSQFSCRYRPGSRTNKRYNIRRTLRMTDVGRTDVDEQSHDNDGIQGGPKTWPQTHDHNSVNS